MSDYQPGAGVYARLGDLRPLLDERARLLGVPVAEVIRRALTEHLAPPAILASPDTEAVRGLFDGLRILDEVYRPTAVELTAADVVDHLGLSRTRAKDILHALYLAGELTRHGHPRRGYTYRPAPQEHTQ